MSRASSSLARTSARSCGSAQVREADQAPVQAPPLAIRVFLRFGRELEERRDNRAVPGGFAVGLDLRVRLRLAKQPRPRAIANRWLIGLQQPVDRPVAFSHLSTLSKRCDCARQDLL